MRTRLALLALAAVTAGLAPSASADSSYSMSVTPEESAQDLTRPVRVTVTLQDVYGQRKGIAVRITNSDPSFTQVLRTDKSGRATAELRNRSGQALDDVWYVAADTDRDDQYEEAGDPERVEVLVHWTEAATDDSYESSGGYRTLDTRGDVLTMTAHPGSAGLLDLGYASRNYRLRYDRDDVYEYEGRPSTYEEFERLLRRDTEVTVTVDYATRGRSQWHLDLPLIDLGTPS